jgi:cation-transporting ATPase I
MGRRRAWAHDGYAHIEAVPASGVDPVEAVRRYEQAVGAVDGVEWAAYNGPLNRLVVRFDADRTNLSRLLRALDRSGAKTTDSGLRLPGLDPVVADRVALGADLFSAVSALGARVVRLPRLPAELAALPAALDVFPRLGKGLRAVLGRTGADLASSLASRQSAR